MCAGRHYYYCSHPYLFLFIITISIVMVDVSMSRRGRCYLISVLSVNVIVTSHDSAQHDCQHAGMVNSAWQGEAHPLGGYSGHWQGAGLPWGLL